jgi:N-acetylglucosamine kinase-like BadF-type ATPase
MINWLSQLPTAVSWPRAVVVDGGGTGSRAAVVEPSGALSAFARGGPTSARVIGDRAARENLVGVISEALDQAPSGSGSRSLCVVSSAAVDTVKHATFLSAAVEQLCVPDGNCLVLPDSFVSWAVTDNMSPAVAVTAGTGSVVFVADPETGFSKRLGGWDFILGDEGSGYAIGRAAIREALLTSEGRSEAEGILSMCLEHLQCEIAEEIFDAVHKPIPNKTLVAAIAEPLLAMASAGDRRAMDIVTREAAYLVDIVRHGIACLAKQAPVVGCFGSLFRSDTYWSAFTAQLGQATGEAQVRVVEASPLGGAFRIALRCARGDNSLVDYQPAVETFDRDIARVLGRG